MAREEGLTFFQRMAGNLSLPAELNPGAPVIEVIGNGELRMSGHRGIVAYGEEEISVSGGRIFVRIKGKGLKLRGMSGSELFISGQLEAVLLE